MVIYVKVKKKITNKNVLNIYNAVLHGVYEHM